MNLRSIFAPVAKFASVARVAAISLVTMANTASAAMIDFFYETTVTTSNITFDPDIIDTSAGNEILWGFSLDSDTTATPSTIFSGDLTFGAVTLEAINANGDVVGSFSGYEAFAIADTGFLALIKTDDGSFNAQAFTDPDFIPLFDSSSQTPLTFGEVAKAASFGEDTDATQIVLGNADNGALVEGTSSINVIAPIPLPATLPLLAAGVVGAAMLTARRRRLVAQ